MVKPLGIGFFEEPLTQNDAAQMAELRRSGIPLACGQNEGLLFRFRDLLLNKAVDVLQPNVAISGGITQCLKIAGLAAAFNTPIDNGGAWPFHNMHLHAGLAHGGMVEYHYLAVELMQQLYRDLPMPEAGFLTLPTGRASASSRTVTRSAKSPSFRCRRATPRGDGAATSRHTVSWAARITAQSRGQWEEVMTRMRGPSRRDILKGGSALALSTAFGAGAVQAREITARQKELYELAKKDGEVNWYTAHSNDTTAQALGRDFEAAFRASRRMSCAPPRRSPISG